MKKTQKVLDSIKYIDNLDLSFPELERLVEELLILSDCKEGLSYNKEENE